MLSGTDWVRTTVQNTERAQRLHAVDAVDPAVNPGKSSLDEDTQSALVRFARFVNKERKSPPKNKPRKKGIPEGYLAQVEGLCQTARSGSVIDVYA
jgi:hypothetical protein